MPYPVAVNDITMVQGEDTPFAFAFLEDDEVTPFSLSGWTLTCEVRRDYNNDLIFAPTITIESPASAGIATMEPTAAQTFKLTMASARYDIYGTHITLGSRRLAKGTITVDPAITHG